MKEIFRTGRIQQGLTFDAYHELVRAQALLAPAGSDVQQTYAAYAAVNTQRMDRLLKTYAVSAEMRRAVAALQQDQVWMVLTEPWCGDSAQIAPVLHHIARITPRIALRFLLRDANADIMDRYLTNGARGIPKLVAFDLAGNELFTWGPRPAPAQQVFQEAKEKGLSKEKALEELHRFYGRDKGASVERELLELLGGD